MKPQIDNARSLLDEHEQRTATYLGRDLTHEERVNIGIDGLIHLFREFGRSIGQFELASEVMEERLKAGETVGAAVEAAIRTLEG